MPGAKARLRLDGADPINRGLLAFWPLNDGAGAVATDLSPRRRNGTLTGFTANGWTAAPGGRALTFDGVDDHIPQAGRWLNNLARGSFCVRLRLNAGGGQAYYEDGGGFNNFTCTVPSPGSGVLAFNIGSNTARNSTTRTWVATTWYDIAVTWGDDIRIYVDGLLDTTIAVSGGTANGSGDNDQIGRYSYGGGNVGGYTPATLSYIRLYNRPLIAGEVRRLRGDSWAGTARRLRQVVATAGTTYSLNAQPLARTYDFTTAALSRGYSLDAAGLARAHSLGTMGFTVGRHLEADALSYGHRVANVALSYNPYNPDTGDTHDGMVRRSRRQRALDAADRRRRDELAQEAVALRLSLEAAMGMAAEVADTAPAEAVEAVQAVAKRAARMVPDLAEAAPDPALLAAARSLVEQVNAAVAEAERRRALAEDDEEVLMLLRAF